MSGFIIFFNGPIHWSSKSQKVTAHSSLEAKIYTTDECVKELLRLQHACTDLITLTSTCLDPLSMRIMITMHVYAGQSQPPPKVLDILHSQKLKFYILLENQI